MSRAKAAGLAVVVLAVAVVAALKVHGSRAAGRKAGQAQCPPGGCDAIPLGHAKGPASPAPKIPTGSGRPNLVEFGSDECEACKKMAKVLPEVRKQYEGRLDVVMVDVDVHREPTTRWRIRLIPTQIFLDTHGKEVARHEGFMPGGEIGAQLAKMGLKPGTTPKGGN